MSDLDLEILSGVTERWVSPEFCRTLLQSTVYFVAAMPLGDETRVRCDQQQRLCIFTNPPTDTRENEAVMEGKARDILELAEFGAVLVSAFGRRIFEPAEVADLLALDLPRVPWNTSTMNTVGDHLWVSRPSLLPNLDITLLDMCAERPEIVQASLVAVEDDEGSRLVLGVCIVTDRDRVESSLVHECAELSELIDQRISVLSVRPGQPYPLSMLERAVIFDRQAA